jgi:hypothetical protein
MAVSNWIVSMCKRSKLRIETRLKLLAKWNPKKWGDKLELAGDQQNPLMIQQITRKVC